MKIRVNEVEHHYRKYDLKRKSFGRGNFNPPLSCQKVQDNVGVNKEKRS